MTRGPYDYHYGSIERATTSGLESLISGATAPGRPLTEEMLVKAAEQMRVLAPQPSYIVSEYMMAMLEDKVEVVWELGNYTRVRYYGKTEILRHRPDPNRDHVGRRHVSRRGKGLGLNAWKRAGYRYDDEYLGIYWPHEFCRNWPHGLDHVCPQRPRSSPRSWEGVPD